MDIQTGVRELQQKNFYEAIKIFEITLYSDPYNKVANLKLAVAYFHIGKVDHANAILKQYVKGYPDDVEAHLYIAKIKESKGEYTEAHKYYDICVELDKKDFKSYIKRASFLIRRERKQQAMKDIEKSIELKAENPDAYNLLGLLQREKDKEQARRSFEKSLGYCKENIVALENLSTIHMDEGNYLKAIDYLQMAVALQAVNENLFYQLGICFLNIENKERAIENFEKVIQLNPHIQLVFFMLGVLNKEIGEYEKAIKYYRKAIELAGSSQLHTLFNEIGFCLLQLENYIDAVRHFRDALDCYTNYGEARCNLGFAYYKLGDYDNAKIELNKALVIDTDMIEAHNNLYLVFMEQGDWVNAKKHLLCIENKISTYDYNVKMSVILMNQRNYSEAQRLLKKAEKENPNLPYAYNSMGLLMATQGMYRKAKKKFQTANKKSEGEKIGKQNMIELKKNLKTNKKSVKTRTGCF